MQDFDLKFMRRAIALAKEGMKAKAGGPFGAVIVKDGEIIAEGYNRVTSAKDPTAHAEVVAIREACQKLDSFQLSGCVIYTSCEPCPMCLGAIYWARPDKVFYGCTKKDAAKIEFDDEFIYKEIEMQLHERTIPFRQLLRDEAQKVFEMWNGNSDITKY